MQGYKVADHCCLATYNNKKADSEGLESAKKPLSGDKSPLSRRGLAKYEGS